MPSLVNSGARPSEGGTWKWSSGDDGANCDCRRPDGMAGRCAGMEMEDCLEDLGDLGGERPPRADVLDAIAVFQVWSTDSSPTNSLR